MASLVNCQQWLYAAILLVGKKHAAVLPALFDHFQKKITSEHWQIVSILLTNRAISIRLAINNYY